MIIYVHVVCVLVGFVIYLFWNLFVNNDCVFIFIFYFDCFNKTYRKTKNRVKSDLEVTIKAIDSKHVEIFSATESTNSKRKEMEFVAKKVGSAVQHIKLKNRKCYGLSPKQGRFAAERLPRQTGQNVQVERWNVWHFGNVQTCLTFPFIYICRYLADRQLLSLAVNTFIYWIPNVMFNPVHHHCHPFTDFIKDSYALSLNHSSLLANQTLFFGRFVCWSFPLVSTDAFIT